MIKKLLWIFGAGAIALLLGIGIWLDTQKNQAKTDNGNKAPATVPKPAPSPREEPVGVTQFLDSKSKGEWYFASEDILNEDANKVTPVGEIFKEKIEQAMSAYVKVPEVKALKEKFGGRLYISYYNSVNDVSVQLLKSAKRNELSNPAFLEVCLFAGEDINAPRMEGVLFHYDIQWQAMVVPALHMDERWFAAIILHELYHAQMAKEGKPSAITNGMTDLYVEEELGGHKIEKEVLDIGTGGRYKKILRQIVQKWSKDLAIKDITKQIRSEDYRDLDNLFMTPGYEEANDRGAQYQLDLGIAFLETKFSGADLAKAKIELYRSLQG